MCFQVWGGLNPFGEFIRRTESESRATGSEGALHEPATMCALSQGLGQSGQTGKKRRGGGLMLTLTGPSAHQT